MPFQVPDLSEFHPEQQTLGGRLPDPRSVEFVSSNEFTDDFEEDELDSDAVYPFVDMLRGSASYISEHRGQVAVFHIPGELIEKEGFADLMDDIALAWLLGLKIVIVLGCRYNHENCPMCSHEYECQNALRITDEETIHALEEDAGYVRFEVERQLNRRLRLHNGMCSDTKDAPAPNGNVVSGNFYTAKRFGAVHGVDYECAGMPNQVKVEKIKQAHEKDDVVLLTTVGNSRMGEPVNINGNHLAAYVAASMGASKLIYFSAEGTVLRNKVTNKHLQDIPLSFTQSLVDHYNVQVHKAGFASFEEAQEILEPSAVEKLLHLGWSSWALENGVKRAHIVGPSNGALLEELFSAKEGANTCIHHDNESDELDDELEDDFDGFPSVLGTSVNKHVNNPLFVASTPPYS